MIKQAKDWPLQRISPSATGGDSDPRRLQVHRAQPERDVPFVPTDEAVVNAMLDLANVGRSDVVYDLGCGDGRIIIEAGKRGARGVGVDIDLQRIHECYENARQASLLDRLQFVRESFFNVDLHEATVVTLYLLPRINRQLRPRLLWELKPGSRIVSNNFDMDDWPADAQYYIYHRILYLWVVPAWINGRWRCVMDGPGGRQQMELRLQRSFQTAMGTLHMGRREVAISEGRLVGDQLTFRAPMPRDERIALSFACRVEGQYLRGSCRFDDESGKAFPLGGVWRSPVPAIGGGAIGSKPA
ncbi:MAG: class I SAM-dependent methyltransferase [Bacillota bacterium]